MNENERMIWLSILAFCFACGVIGWIGELLLHGTILRPCCN